jgi:HAD superfamily hydrolase (TIGR01549 family)
VTNPTRGLLFDFGGTLDHPHHWLDRFLRHYRDSGIELSRAELDCAYSHATRTAYANDGSLYHHGLRDLVRFLVDHQFDYLRRHGPAEIREHLARADAGRHRLAERIAAAFADESAQGLARSRELLAELSRKFKLGVVSNFYGNLDVILFEAGIREIIQVAADSKRLGIFKPDRRIFEVALKALDLPHGCVAMVGDSLHKDCAPARGLGMYTIWLRGAHGCAGGSAQAGEAAAIADQTIDSLDQLKGIRWETAGSAER